MERFRELDSVGPSYLLEVPGETDEENSRIIANYEAQGWRIACVLDQPLPHTELFEELEDGKPVTKTRVLPLTDDKEIELANKAWEMMDGLIAFHGFVIQLTPTRGLIAENQLEHGSHVVAYMVHN